MRVWEGLTQGYNHTLARTHTDTRIHTTLLFALKLVFGFVCCFCLFSFYSLDVLPPVFILLETQRKQVYFYHRKKKNIEQTHSHQTQT